MSECECECECVKAKIQAEIDNTVVTGQYLMVTSAVTHTYTQIWESLLCVFADEFTALVSCTVLHDTSLFSA